MDGVKTRPAIANPRSEGQTAYICVPWSARGPDLGRQRKSKTPVNQSSHHAPRRAWRSTPASHSDAPPAGRPPLRKADLSIYPARVCTHMQATVHHALSFRPVCPPFVPPIPVSGPSITPDRRPTCCNRNLETPTVPAIFA